MTSKPITVRIRSKDGMFRVDNLVPERTTIQQLKSHVEQETGVAAAQQVLSLEAPLPSQAAQTTQTQKFDDRSTLAQVGIKQHGQLVYLSYDASKIKSKQDLELEKQQKKRAEELGDGDNLDSLGLRYRQKNWTLSEYLSLVEKHKVIIKHQKYAVTQRVSLDSNAAHAFQLFARQLQFAKQRVGYLVGAAQASKRLQEDETTESGEKAKEDPNENSEEHDYRELYAAVVYEPPQDNMDSEKKEFNEIANDKESRVVDELSQLLGMERIGWVVTHDGTRDYPLAAREIIRAAELQAKYGDHFVTLTCFPNEQGHTEFEAFQVSKQCVDMFKRGMLKAHETDPELVLTIKPVEIQRKRTNEIEGVLLITNVAITSYQSQLRVQFPIENRVSAFFPEYARNYNAAKQYLQTTAKAQKDGAKLKFVEVLSDFHFLLFLTDYLDLKSDFPVICAAVREQDDELCSGYELLIKSQFGLPV